jgi:hypothetical protein
MPGDVLDPKVPFLAAPAQWPESEIKSRLMECVRLLGPIEADVVPVEPIRNGDCGTPAPVLLRSIGGTDAVVFNPPLLVNCRLVVSLHRWLEEKVQPAARAMLGSPVSRIIGSSYSCRNRYFLPNDRLSQHAFANGVDVPVFVLADGRKIDIASNWGPTRRDLVAGARLVPVVSNGAQLRDQEETTSNVPTQPDSLPNPAQPAKVIGLIQTRHTEAKPKLPVADLPSTPQAKFLRHVHQGGCEVFSTVLGPEANDVHRTHLHLDLQDRGPVKVCR